jgi:hypothetical protein
MYSDQAKVDWLLFGLNQELLNALSMQAAIPNDFVELRGTSPAVDQYRLCSKSSQLPLHTSPELPQAARQTEREPRRVLGLCFYCGESNHAARYCPRIIHKRAQGPRLQVQAEN